MTLRSMHYDGDRCVLAVHASTNTPGINPRTGKPWKDATGAFIPEARAWAQFHGGTAHPFDNEAPKGQRRAEVDRIIGRRGHTPDTRVDAVGIFCHGLTRSLQTGHVIGNVDRLANALTNATKPGAKVVLYACSAADTPVKNGPGGDDGFADRLRDALIHRAPSHWYFGHVDAHVTAGHATTNPYVRRFTCNIAVPSETVLGIVGGEWIVPPGSKWWKAWDAALHGDLRFRFPFMSIAEIRAELER